MHPLYKYFEKFLFVKDTFLSFSTNDFVTALCVYDKVISVKSEAERVSSNENLKYISLLLGTASLVPVTDYGVSQQSAIHVLVSKIFKVSTFQNARMYL